MQVEAEVQCLSSGCYNKSTVDCGLNNRHLFLTIPEVGKSRIRALADSMSSEGLLLAWFIDGCLPHVLT